LSPGAARCPRAPGGRPVIQSGRHATPGPRADDLPRRRMPPAPPPETDARARLAALVADLALGHGRVTLSSGREADYYVYLRRATLHHVASPHVGRLLRELTADWDFDAVGGLTHGADPVATAIMHAPGRPIDAFVVRKEAKKHGMQRRVEGPGVEGKRVLVVEDTTTPGTPRSPRWRRSGKPGPRSSGWRLWTNAPRARPR